MLVISRRMNESIVIGNNVTLTIVEIRGDKVRLAVTSPLDMSVHRKEVYDALHPPPSPEPPPRSPEELAFLDAILEEPDDEGLRLIFADWLQERDDPRGEHIRLQCQLATLPADDEQRAEMQVRERALWSTHAAAWRAYLPPVLRYAPFERGFVETVHLTIDQFLDNAAAIFAAAPVRRLRVESSWATHPLEPIKALAASPYLSRLSSLDASNRLLGDGEAAVLAGSVHTASLLSLVLRGNNIGDAGAAALAASPHLEGLTVLDVTANKIGEEGKRALRARFGSRARL